MNLPMLGTVDDALAGAVTDGLGQVEAMLREQVKSDYPFLAEAGRHLLDAGGKRFRPVLTLTAAHFGDPDAPGVVPSAVVVELTHLATLYHDDVMDEAPMRRGAPSANSRWTNTVAILTGDFLFARASDLLADLGPDCVRIQARTFERLVTGQIRETVGPGADDDPLAHYLAVLADKTGSLIGTSAQFGALLAGAHDGVVAAATRFGERIGVAFQLSDDLIDIAASSGESGKTPGTDLREGIPTLPTLLVRADDSAQGREVVALLDGDLSDDARLDDALVALRAHPAMDQARDEVIRWANEARDALDACPAGPARDALGGLASYVVERTG